MSTYNLSEKHIRMYMRQAREMANPEHNSCLSRAIGVVIVQRDLPGGRIVGSGYNGPVSGLPKCDSEEHLRGMVWPQLTEDEKKVALETAMKSETYAKHRGAYEGVEPRTVFSSAMADCGQCPRRLIGAPSGQRLELCSCAHAERNAIVRATESLQGSAIFCWCQLPCHECASAIIQSGIKQVVCLKFPTDYSPSSRWMLGKANIPIDERDGNSLDSLRFTPV